MLTKFAVKNYRGFAKRIEFDLSQPSNYTFNTFAVQDGVVKNGILYGPNGSGKSNLALALFDIVNHLSQKLKKPDYYKNFVYAGEPTALVEFEYTFKLGIYTIFYSYSKDAQGSLMSEKMDVDDKEVFHREKGELSIDNQSYPMDEMMKTNLAENANNVSIVNFLLTSYPLPSNHYLLLLQQFVNGMLWFKSLDTREFIGLENTVTNLGEYIIQQGLVDDFSRFMEEISSQHFSFVPPAVGDKILYCTYGDSKIPFDEIASTGTQSLKLLYFWIQRMSRASFVFIDEFDAFYHFKLSYKVCKEFFALDCQVFASSHNTYLMTNNLLRPDCNFILNDNVIKPLSECTAKELRFGHNIEKMFRGGTFAL